MERTSNKRGFSLIELLIVMAIVTTLTALVSVTASTIFKHSRETAALGHVRTLQNAQTQVHSVKRRFAASLKDLAVANLIPEHLAAGALGGYTFALTGAEEGFIVKACPERQGKSGDANYFTDESLVIRQNDQREADKESPPVK